MKKDTQSDNNIHTLFLEKGNKQRKVIFDASEETVQTSYYLWRHALGFCIVNRTMETVQTARLTYKKLLKKGYHSKPWIIEGTETFH